MESTKDKETLCGKGDDEPSRDDIPGTTQAPSNGGKPINASIRDTVTTALLEDCETEGDENPRPKHSEDVASDPELDELLDCKCSVVCAIRCVNNCVVKPSVPGNPLKLA